MREVKEECGLTVGDTIYVKEKEYPTGEPFDSWLGKPQIVTDITWDNFDECYFIKVRGNDDWWRKIWWEVKDFSETQETQTQENNKGNEMTKIKTVMKHIRTKVALNEELDTNEYNLVEFACESYLKGDLVQWLSNRSWDIKFQDALSNIKDQDGKVIPHYYFQLLSCNLSFKTDNDFKWISDEIIKLMLDNMDGENNSHVLFSSNNLNITVDIKTQRLVMQRAIRRGKEHTIENTKVYIYKYALENLSWFADDLIQASK